MFCCFYLWNFTFEWVLKLKETAGSLSLVRSGESYGSVVRKRQKLLAIPNSKALYDVMSMLIHSYNPGTNDCLFCQVVVKIEIAKDNVKHLQCGWNKTFWGYRYHKQLTFLSKTWLALGFSPCSCGEHYVRTSLYRPLFRASPSAIPRVRARPGDILLNVHPRCVTGYTHYSRESYTKLDFLVQSVLTAQNRSEAYLLLHRIYVN